MASHSSDSSARSDKGERYRKTQDDFEAMEFEEQASFLVEATASTLARGLERAGRMLADGLDDAFRQATRGARSSGPDAPHGPGAAEPETSQRQAPKE